jgi:hypothetical protein
MALPVGSRRIRCSSLQERHNVATAAEEVGFRKSEVAELLNHTNSTVTDRYIDDRVKRHREMLTAINEHYARMLFEPAPDIHRPMSVADGLTGTSSLVPLAPGASSFGRCKWNAIICSSVGGGRI